jgi:hypothetical protein
MSWVQHHREMPSSLRWNPGKGKRLAKSCVYYSQTSIKNTVYFFKKYTVNKTKRPPTDWERIFTIPKYFKVFPGEGDSRVHTESYPIGFGPSSFLNGCWGTF